MNSSPPPKLGRYEVLEELGKGAMGVVYLARDPLIGRLVALKTFRLGFSANDQELEQFRSRFVREAQSAGILSHPNIVTIHDVVDEGPGGMCFIAMEYVKGTNLKQLLQRPEPFSREFLVHVIAQIAEGLDYAHSRGVVHRDIKPANILITPEEQVKITDFGIARLESSNLTLEGQLLGTPNYMAPEQIQGREVDHRADIFSLGVVFYEMLTRRKPFQGENLTVVTHKIVYEPFTPPEQIVRDLPPVFGEVLRRCLEKDPNRRFARASEIAKILRRSLEQKPSGRDPDESPDTQEVLPLEQQKTRLMPDAAALGIPPAAAAPASSPPVASPPALSQPPLPPAAGVSEGRPSPASVPPTPPPPKVAPSAVPQPAPVPKPPLSRRPIFLVGAGLGALLVLVAAGALWWGSSESSNPQSAAAVVPPTPEELQKRLAVDAALNEARSAFAEDALQRALEAVQRAEGMDPTHPDIPVLRQQIEQRSRELEALALLERQVTEGMVAAREAFAKRRYEEAIAKAKEVLRLRPELPEATRLLQDAELALERQRERQRLAREARDVLERPAVSSTPTPAPPPPVIAQPTPVVAKDAKVRVAFQTEVGEGVLTVYAGERQMIREPFRFVKKSGLLKTEAVPGSLDLDMQLPPGRTTLRVYVSQPGKPTRSQALDVQISPGSQHTLKVQVDSEGRMAVRFE